MSPSSAGELTAKDYMKLLVPGSQQLPSPLPQFKCEIKGLVESNTSGSCRCGCTERGSGKTDTTC